MAHAPRKSAKQERSRSTIDALLEATARILGQAGPDATTTNRIAEVAGVSVGSLYQYFPGKTAIVASLIEREARGDLETMRAVFRAIEDEPFERAIERGVTELVLRHARNPGLYRWLLRYVPELGQHEKIRAIAAEGRALLRDFLVVRRNEWALGREPALAALVLGSAVEASVHTALFERPETLTDGTLARELTRLSLGYLEASPAP